MRHWCKEKADWTGLCIEYRIVISEVSCKKPSYHHLKIESSLKILPSVHSQCESRYVNTGDLE